MVASSDSEHLQRLFVALRATIRRIPSGKVATYGQVAELSGIPGGARIAAAALKTSKPSDRLPWQRVIGKAGPRTGRIAIHDPVGAAVQRELLEAEGVEVGDKGRISLERYQWWPSAVRTRAARGRGASPRRRPRSGSKRRASSSRR